MSNLPREFDPFIKIKTIKGSNVYTLSVAAYTGSEKYELDGSPRHELSARLGDQLGTLWLTVTLKLKVSESIALKENWFYTSLTLDDTVTQDPSVPSSLPDSLIPFADKLQVVIETDVQTETKATIIYTDPEPDDPFKI